MESIKTNALIVAYNTEAVYHDTSRVLSDKFEIVKINVACAFHVVNYYTYVAWQKTKAGIRSALMATSKAIKTLAEKIIVV